MELLKKIAEYVQQGEEDQVAELTNQAVKHDIPPEVILNEGLIAGMNVVGEMFGRNELFLPEVLLAAKAMCAGQDIIKPMLIEGTVSAKGKIVLGTVQGDLHDIGKNLVGIMASGAGFDIIDLGKDVPAEKFVETAEAEQAQLIGMSALLTTTMPVMKQVVEMLKDKGLDSKIKTMVGGSPVTADFADQIGADGFAYDASSAVESFKEMIGG
jgi:5-methyltetrahydrofolate--homocysteine methyltransferase